MPWRALLDALPDAIAVVDRRDRIVYANRRLHDLTGHPQGWLAGRPLEVLVPAAARTRHRRHTADFHEHPRTGTMGPGRATTCRHADGSDVPVDIALSALPIGEGWVVAVVRDGRERLATEQELFHRATHDPLTGLPNRALLEDRLAQSLHRAEREGPGVTVLYVDLDHFKPVNDADGHRAGDRVLRDIAAALVDAFRPADTVARIGGDEFVVLCDRADGDMADRVVAAVDDAARRSPSETGRDVTASVGLATSRLGDTADALLDRADAAMYEAKRAGGHRSRSAA
jgi:diguanylate cyclase (GGDEF)-like protein/PAS domain S-box-containing protein